jgi:hypothetical protein
MFSLMQNLKFFENMKVKGGLFAKDSEPGKELGEEKELGEV